jgi:hypothetical protein
VDGLSKPFTYLSAIGQGQIRTEPKQNPAHKDNESPSRSPYSNDKYTVGWICALSISYSSFIFSTFCLLGSRFLDPREGYIIRALDDLHSILDIPEDRDRSIRLHHPSFRDSLTKRDVFP